MDSQSKTKARLSFFKKHIIFFSGENPHCRRRSSKKIITSDHCGFAGRQTPARHPTPASSRSPELSTSVQVGIPECSKHTHIPKQKGAPLGSALAVLSVRRADQIRNHKPHDGDQEEQADRYQQKHQNRALLILLYGQDSHQ